MEDETNYSTSHTSYEQIQLARERTKMSVERTQLAAERTFSAWVRMGLAGMGGGIALIRLLEFRTPNHALLAFIIGLLLMVWGMAIFLIALVSYLRHTKSLESVKGEAISKIGVTFVGVMILILAILLIIISFDFPLF